MNTKSKNADVPSPKEVLNDRQRLFCLYAVTGHSASEAYMLAGYASESDEAARANASRLIANDNVKAYLGELRAKAETKAVMTLQEKREYLARIVRTPIGEGVLQDYKEAVKWWTKAAEQGYAKAQYNLGVMYSQGQGVLQDHAKAHMWYNIAAAHGLEQARTNRDTLAEKMTSEQIAEAQKMAREWMEKHGE
jgi:TPR repeat protein